MPKPQPGSATPILVLKQADPLHRFILETFATIGRSPSLDEIVARLDLATPADAEVRVAALERSGAIHRDAGDAAITHAYPFSNKPTDHRVELSGGPAVFAMCAVDALGMPFMLRRDARIASACAECRCSIEIEVEGSAIARHAPAEIVVWIGDRAKGCVAATDLCPDLNFFCSPDHLSTWRGRSGASGAQLTLLQALARGRQVFEHVMA